MSKNYDLYPKSERKIDNWRRRILGYEKMKRDLQRQIQLLKNKNKKQKEVIDKAIETLEKGITFCENDSQGIYDKCNIAINRDKRVLNILKEVSE